mgnify:CR=1 FL=1
MNEQKDDIAMQARCLGCLREHYAPSVLLVSTGGVDCGACGYVSRRMTRQEYMTELRQAHANYDKLRPVEGIFAPPIETGVACPHCRGRVGHKMDCKQLR